MPAFIPSSAVVFLALAGAAVALADLPKKAPLSRYSSLWSNSPFTSKPPPAEAGLAENPLDDYALIGVSPIGGTGYRVTLINKKKPEERITVDSDKPSKDGFKIVEVIRKAGDPQGTTVRMNSGSMTGIVAFDAKLLTLAAAPKAAVQPGQQLIPGQPLPQAVDPNQRQPRPRVVPPPLPNAGVPPQPGVAPQANPPGVPAAPQLQQLQQRPTRRGN
ncbi:MAG: hypothetical protein ACRDBP_03530 [Luteolibacter sp.]